MKAKLFFIFNLLVSSLIVFAQNQLVNNIQIIEKANNIQQINETGAKSVSIYDYTKSGDPVLVAHHDFTYNQNKQIEQINSILYDSCTMMNLGYLLPSGSYVTSYLYDENGIVSEIMCKNTDGDTMEKMQYIHFQDSSICIYQAMKNNILTNQIKMIFYGIKNFNHTPILDEVHTKTYVGLDLVLYHSDSTEQYTWLDTCWTLYQVSYFDYNNEGLPLQLLTTVYSSSGTGYFYDSLYYDTENFCNKIIKSLSMPQYQVYGRVQGFTIKKDNQNKISEKMMVLYNDIIRFDIYGEKESYVYDDDGVLLKINFYRGLTEYNWELTKSYVYNTTAIRESENNYLNVYPNPTNNNLTIESENALMKDIYLYNAMGQQVKHVSINANQSNIEVNNLPIGMYILKINTNQGVLTRKIQIMR